MRRFALIGAGFIGGVHAGNLAAHPEVDFALVYDVDEERAKSVADKHNARVGTLDEVFDPAAVDAVFIASSTDTHADHLRRAAEAGLAVLCEKPIDLDFAGPPRWFSTRMDRGVVAMVDFNRRFDRDYAEFRRVVASGGVGKVQLIQMTSRGPSLPSLDYIAVSGGQMRDQTVHFFDLARWIARRGTRGRVRDRFDVDRAETAASTATSTSPRSPCDSPVARWSRSTVPVRSATDTTSASRYSDQPAWSKHAAIGPAPCRATTKHQVVDDGLHDGWFERVAASYRTALDHFVDALECRSARSAPTCPRR